MKRFITEAISDPESLDGRIELVRRAYRAEYPDPDDGPYSWVTEVYDDVVIVESGDEWTRRTYSIDDDSDVTFGEPERVMPAVGYTPIAEATDATLVKMLGSHPLYAVAEGTPSATRWAEAKAAKYVERMVESDGRILEALEDDDGEIGSKWRVTMIRPGTSRNRRRYRPEVLQEAVPLYEGVVAFDGHRTPAEIKASATRNIAGFHSEVEAMPDGSLQSTLTLLESATEARGLFMTAFKNNRPDLVGFSHDVSGGTTRMIEAGRLIEDVTGIDTVRSVDIVADASAGGQLERLVASGQKGEPMPLSKEEIHELLDGLDDDARAEALSKYEIKPPEADPEGGGAPAPVITETPDEDDKPRLLEAGSLEQRYVLKEALDESKLPADTKTKIAEAVKAGDWTEDQILGRITEATEIWDTLAASVSQPLPGQRVTVEGEDDTRQAALDGMIAGKAGDDVRPFMSMKEAFAAYSGHSPFDTEDFNRRLLAESVGAFASQEDARRMTESIISSTWSSALGDSITRRAIAEYQDPNLSTWRTVVSSTPPVTDFRTQRRDRIGGYDVLETIGEAGTYPALTSPTDEEATYAVTKKGGVEDLTLETIANDDIGAVQRIPRSLGRAAALTLYRAVWIDIVVDTPAIYDGTALFHADHNNTTGAALGEAGIGTLRNLMVTQTRLGESSGFLAAMPRFIIVPPELFVTAFKLTQSNSSVAGGEAASNAFGGGDISNPWQGMVPVEVPLFTDADNWFLTADPNSIPMLEVGFYQGREDPEILVQDAPAVGSVFTADKVTYKVRHIWGLTVLDYRGFQRGTQ